MEHTQPSRLDVLALDLEGTLISNAMSQIARPGLYEFLERCQMLFPRIVMFTTVREDLFRDIARLLVAEEAAPAWFQGVEYVHWQGKTKDLSYIANAVPARTVLVDDFEAYVHPGQEAQWLAIAQFEHPYSDTDTGLLTTLQQLEVRVYD